MTQAISTSTGIIWIPTNSTGVWHRMGRVLLFAIPAQLGLKGVQIVPALLFIATIFTAYKILKAKT
jgi:hypothetical protein